MIAWSHRHEKIAVNIEYIKQIHLLENQIVDTDQSHYFQLTKDEMNITHQLTAAG